MEEIMLKLCEFSRSHPPSEVKMMAKKYDVESRFNNK